MFLLHLRFSYVFVFSNVISCLQHTGWFTQALSDLSGETSDRFPEAVDLFVGCVHWAVSKNIRTVLGREPGKKLKPPAS